MGRRGRQSRVGVYARARREGGGGGAREGKRGAEASGADAGSPRRRVLVAGEAREGARKQSRPRPGRGRWAPAYVLGYLDIRRGARRGVLETGRCAPGSAVFAVQTGTAWARRPMCNQNGHHQIDHNWRTGRRAGRALEKKSDRRRAKGGAFIAASRPGRQRGWRRRTEQRREPGLEERARWGLGRGRAWRRPPSRIEGGGRGGEAAGSLMGRHR